MSKRVLRSSRMTVDGIEPLYSVKESTSRTEKEVPRKRGKKSKNVGNVAIGLISNTVKGNIKNDDTKQFVEKRILSKMECYARIRILYTIILGMKTQRVKKSKFTGESMEQRQMRETIGADLLFIISFITELNINKKKRQWNSKPMDEETVERWYQVIKVSYTGYPIDQIIPHGSYLMNPGSPNEEKLAKSHTAMLDECQRAERLGILYYNFHPGMEHHVFYSALKNYVFYFYFFRSTTGECTHEESIRTVASTINYIIENTKNIIMVIETMAGQGHTVGGTFEEIRDMIQLVSVTNKLRVGVCIDTCHIFAAGYDIRTKKAYDKTMKHFDEVIGFKYLKAFHINDSKGDLGCRLDRHEHIGKGKIGKAAFGFIMDDPRLDSIPLVLETPEGEYPKEMMLMYGMQTNH
uniref:AP_endonuc_2 domain-containing protein n=1 Tax=Heterorhabditis bacteriophora TaxID=37862 RepID=A0A1I7WH70_HETBA